MFKFLRKRKTKGQSTLEYAVLIVIVIGALLSIQVYIKRGIQGRLKTATDDIGDQYSPGNTNVAIVHHTTSNTHDTFKFGVTNSSLEADEVTTMTRNQEIINGILEFWGN